MKTHEDAFFSKCFRVRSLINDNPSLATRYRRKDEWGDKTATVSCAIEFRTKIQVDETEYEFMTGQRLNDVCFSVDGLTLYLLYESGTVVIADV